MPTSYDAIAPEYARHRAGQPFVIERLRRLHTRSGGDAVLEVGCGTGDYAAAIAQTGSCTVYALDLSGQMLRHAPALDSLLRVQGHAGSLPFADGALDMVFSVNVIHHLDTVVRYFREAFRALRPGGIFCTATDSAEIIRRRQPLSEYWPATVPVELQRYHDVEGLHGEMYAAGFRHMESCEDLCEFSVTGAGPYRDKAFSCLQLIPEDAFLRGLRAMEADLRAGPVEGVSELHFLWGEHP